MFLLSWLKSFEETVRLSSPRARSHRKHQGHRPSQSHLVERLEERLVLTFSPAMNAIPTPSPIANNLVSTQLTNSVPVGSGSFVVTDASVFPAAPFDIRLESETLTVTNVTGNALTLLTPTTAAHNGSATAPLEVAYVLTINLSGITNGDGGFLTAGQITVDSVTPTAFTNDLLLRNLSVVFPGNQTTARLRYEIDALGLSGTNVVNLKLDDGVDAPSIFSVTISVYDPTVLISNWRGGAPGEFAQVIDQSDTATGPVTTWPGQSSPDLSNVTQINSTANSVYISAPELADYVMGPWNGLNPSTTLPKDQQTIFRFNQGPTPAVMGSHTQTDELKAVGLLVNGVAIHDQRDGFSWNNNPSPPFNPGVYKTSGSGFGMPKGDGFWNRNTAEKDPATLDHANGHPSTSISGEYHNHINPVALRAELYDNIYYSGSTATGLFPFDRGVVTGASNTSPIVITSAGHHLANGWQITISGVNGNTAANGNFKVDNVTANTFELVDSDGNGTYTSGGTWSTVEIRPDFDSDNYDEETDPNLLRHSPIIGWALDGYPIYGPYGYSDPLDDSSSIERIDSSFQLRSITTRTALPGFAAQARFGDNVTLIGGEFPLLPNRFGPDVSGAFPLGYFVEDFEYVPGLGDLDQYNSRFTVTPEFPNGTQAYFMTIDASGDAAFPFSVGRQFFGKVTAARVTSIPTTATLEFDANNTPPSFSFISDRTIYLNTSTGPLNFTFSDTQTPISQLNVEFDSSNRTLVPLSGVVLNGSGASRTVTVTPAANQVGTTTIKLSAVDGLDARGSVSFTVNVVSGRNIPTLDDLLAMTGSDFLTIEDAGQHALALRGITDADGNTQPLNVTATTSDSTLIQNLLVAYSSNLTTATAFFKTAPNASGTATISVKVEDGGFDRNLATPGDNQFTTKTISVQVGPSADAPTLNTPASPTIAESLTATQRSVEFGNLTDGDANTQSLRISATSSNQTLIPDASLLFNFGGADLAATPFVQLAKPAPNAGILRYTPAAQRSGVATITMVVTDAGPDLNFGTTDDQTITRFFTVTVTPVNDRPRVDAAVSLDSGVPTTGPLEVNANLTLPLVSHTIDLTGIDPGPFESTQQLRVTVSSNNGTLISNPTVSYTPGSSVAQVTFTPNQNQSGIANLTVQIVDEGADGDINRTFDNLVFNKVISVKVKPFNNPPTLNPVALPTGALSAAVVSPTVTTITLVDASKFPATASVANPFAIQVGNERMRVVGVSGKTFTVQRGTFFGTTPASHPVTDAVSQIVMEDTNETQIALPGITAGALGTAGGTETQILKVTPSIVASSIPGLISNLAVDYASPNTAGTLRFTPAPNLFGTATIRVTVEDAGLNGTLVDSGTTDNATFFRDITITVNNIADLPTLNQPANLVFVEGVSSNLIPLSGISDGDLNTQSLTITATNGNSPLFNSNNIPVLFTQSLINPDATLQNATLDLTSVLQPAASGTAVITVNVTDANGTTTKTFNLQVASIAANDPPTLNAIVDVSRSEDTTSIPITLAGISAGPNESQNLTITVTSDQPTKIPSLGAIAYTQGSPTAAFDLLPVANAFGDVNITVTVTDDSSIATDSTPKSFSKTFKVTLTPVNDAPTLNASTGSIAENSANGTAVLTLDFQDIDTPNNQLGFSIVTGNTGGAFSIDGNGVLRVANSTALNFEATPSFTLKVKVNDNSAVAPTGLSSLTQDITVNLTDTAETLLINVGNWAGTSGLTLVRTGDLGETLRIRNSGNNQNIAAIPAQAFAKVTNVVVFGRANVLDTLTLDYTGGDPVPAGGLVFNADSNTSDTLRFVNATFNQLETVFSSANSASISDSGSPTGPIQVVNVEVLKFEASVSATSSLRFVFNETANVVAFAEDGLATNDLSKFTSSSAPTVIFPTLAKLSLDVGHGNNRVTFTSIEDPDSGPAITVQGGSGNDEFTAGTSFARSLLLLGGAGNDTLIGGINADTLQGEEGNDVLTGLLGNDSIDGGSGATESNTLVETANLDMFLDGSNMIGGLGNDSVSNIQFAKLTGGASGNMISTAGFSGRATIDGAAGNDTITGSGNGDLLTGGLGDDGITGGGLDTLVESGNVNFVLTDTSLTGLGTDVLSNFGFARLIGGTSANTLNAGGFSGSATLQGGAGDDVLIGGAGSDSLMGEDGNDTLTGGGGNNTLSGGGHSATTTSLGDQVFETGDFNFTVTATQVSGSDGSTSTFTQIESVKLVGGEGDNSLTVSGYTGPTFLFGGNGNDTLTGGTGKDSLDGGAGNDQLTGGLGDDTFNGGANTDTIVELGVSNLTLTPTTMSGRGNDKLISGTIEEASLTGTAGNDTINGSTFTGAMIIRGLAGQDRLTGGTGNDLIDGGDETVLVAGKLKGDTIVGGKGNDTIFGGAGNDNINGGDGHDAIDGQAGNDTISGDNGDDTLIGGIGRDSLTGGNSSESSTSNDLLYSGDFLSGNVSDGEADTLISGTGIDTVIGEAGVDNLSNTSNLASEIDATFSFDYLTIFDKLLNP
ncbi:MAG: YHYH protein [Planctomycetes bacterium]|nr:YHYH protein [Planctomycetota bacterium]